jgi:hypothetical protein
MDSSCVPALLADISRLMQAGADLTLREEESVLFRPLAAGTAAVAVILRALECEVASPLLGARTRDEFVELLVDCIEKFTESRAAFRILRRQGLVRSVEVEESIERIRRRAEKVGGAEMADEFEFAASTFRRAIRLAISTKANLDGEKRQRDIELIRTFSTFRDIFQCSQYVLHAAAERDPTDDIQVAVSTAIELLRGSALYAYGAARERDELWKPPQEILEPLPFDEEDSWLAGIAS